MGRSKEQKANPHAWSDADYEAKGLVKITLRVSRTAYERLAKLAQRLGIGRTTVVEVALEQFDHSTKKDA